VITACSPTLIRRANARSQSTFFFADLQTSARTLATNLCSRQRLALPSETIFRIQPVTTFCRIHTNFNARNDL